MNALITTERKAFHQALLKKTITTSKGVPNFADKNQKSSTDISKKILGQLGQAKESVKAAGQTAGTEFEECCTRFIEKTFSKLGLLRPGKWDICRVGARGGNGISYFEQYSHLSDLRALSASNPTLASVLGNDYTITPDIIILREPEDDSFINSQSPIVDNKSALRSPLRKSVNTKNILHASISCKWTLRSDRAQNARAEALNLMRNRKGRCPHISVISAEPSPSRLASLALGTGDIDCVYHFALYELIQSVKEIRNDEAQNILNTMIEGKRLKDISDIPLDLCV
jgi:NgoMIV restriction enzyme